MAPRGCVLYIIFVIFLSHVFEKWYESMLISNRIKLRYLKIKNKKYIESI